MSEESRPPAPLAVLVPHDRFLEYQRQRRHLRAMARAASDTSGSTTVVPTGAAPADAPTVNLPTQPARPMPSPAGEQCDSTSACPQS